VHAGGEFDLGVGQVARVAEDVDGLAADGGQEHFEVAARDQFGVHAAGFLEQHAAQVGLAAAEALGHAGQVPHRLDGGLGDHGGAVGGEQLAVGLEAALLHRLDHLGQDDVGLGDRDGRADVQPAAISSLNTSATAPPQGSRLTILPPSSTAGRGR
jgi:hypothetical protein